MESVRVMRPVVKTVIQVDHEIRLNLADVPVNLVKQIKQDLTLPNPEYKRALKHGRKTHGIPIVIQMYAQLEDRLILPRGYGSTLVKRLSFAGIDCKMDDKRIVLPPVGFKLKDSVKLRDYQEQAVSRLVNMRQGGVTAPCGAGKTIILLSAMARINQPTLWITHTQELANQTMERAYQVLELKPKEIGMFGGGKKQLGKRFTVGLVQTLKQMDLHHLSQQFGCVIVDEAHHLAASTFYDTVNEFPALYRLWASATPERSDGLTRMIFMSGGPILHEIDRSQVPTITPTLKVVETEFSECFEPYNDLMTRLCNDYVRNELIVDTVLANAEGNYSLVLSERVEHLQTLAHMMKLKQPDLSVGILTGSIPKRQRNHVMEQVRAKEVDVLFATQLAREGLDITHLNRLYLAMPKRSESAIEQECGRIMRKSEGKRDAVVFDFADLKSGVLEAQFKVRQNVYNKLEMIEHVNQG